MKILYPFILLVYSGLSMASGKPVACMFDVVIKDKPEKISKDRYRITIVPVKRVMFKHKGWVDTDWICLPMGKEYKDVVYLSKSTALRLTDQKIGATLRLVRQNIGGELPPDGEWADLNRIVIWPVHEYTTGTPLR